MYLRNCTELSDFFFFFFLMNYREIMLPFLRACDIKLGVLVPPHLHKPDLVCPTQHLAELVKLLFFFYASSPAL